MTNEQNISMLLAHLAASLRCAPLCLNEKNQVELALDEDMSCVISYEKDLESFVLSIFIAPVAPEDGELFYDLLCGNYLWGYTSGGTLGIDRESGILTLHRLMALPVERPEIFENIFSALIGAARYWHTWIVSRHTDTSLAERQTLLSL